MPDLTANWADFVKGVSARIDEIIDDTKELAPSFQSFGLHKTENADGQIYRTSGVTGLNYLEIFDEGDSITEDKSYDAYNTEYVMKQSGKIVSISQMLAKTRMSELEAKLDEVRQSMIAANRTLNRWAWAPLIDGFGTTDSNANFPTARLADGVALYSASHPSKVPGVSTRSNLVASNPVLSNTSIFTATKQIKEQLNGRSLPIGYEGKFVLVVPPALEKKAVELTNSILKPDSTDNNINYYNGIVDVMVVNYLGNAANGVTNADTSWYIFAKDAGMQTPLRYVTLISPKIEKEVDFDTKSIRVSVDMAVAFGYSNWEFTVASDGSAS